MVKTRSQALNSTVKKEEHEDKYKLQKDTSHVTNSTSKRKNRITKNKSPIQAQIPNVKTENKKDNKALLSSQKLMFTRKIITTEQIANLISCIVKDKMSMEAASKKAGMSSTTARRYYQKYKDDPEHKIPLPKIKLYNSSAMVIQHKVEKLIQYITHDGMKLIQASKKADLAINTARRYYAKYLKDPERKIPLLNTRTSRSNKCFTKEDIADFIGYVFRDKLSLIEAARKANMSQTVANAYYLKYLHDPNHEIPEPRKYGQRGNRRCTDDQIKSLIGYIVNDGMTLSNASVKANMNRTTARKYYYLYLEDPKNNTATPETNDYRATGRQASLEQVKNFFYYIIVDKLNVSHAASKAKIWQASGYRYYRKYLKNTNKQIKIQDNSFSVEKMKQLIELVQKKNMNLTAAADLVHLSPHIARQHYHKYLEDPLYEFPENKTKPYTQEDMKILIESIERDQMSIQSAAKKIKMSTQKACQYYREYQNDPEHQIHAPLSRGYIKKCKAANKYAQIIAEIYKNNPSIEPVYGNHNPELDLLSIKVKNEDMK